MQNHGRVLSLAFGVLGAMFASAADARDRALVVGVNQYPALIRDGVGGGANLSGAVPDARTFAGLLVDIFKFDQGDVRLLTDGEATRANILAGIEDWLIAGSSPGDRVVLYFSGHGATAAVEDAPGQTRLTSTIVPSDAHGDLDKEPLQVDGMIEGRTIGALLKRLDGRRVMVFADSCHSGSVTRGLEGRPSAEGAKARTITPHVPVAMRPEAITRAIEVEAKTENRLLDSSVLHSGPSEMAVWSAATVAQLTFDLPDGSGGIFTQSFAQGLRDKKAGQSPGGEVTAGNLFQYVRGEAKAFCERQGANCSAGLTPDLQAPASYLTSLLNPALPPQSPATAPNAQQVVHDAVNLFTHRNDFPLKAEILPGAHVKLGEAVKFRVTSGAPGTLMVVDTGPDGKLRQIFPNARSEQTNKRGRVSADSPITIPDASYGFVFKATDPGPGTLLVLVAEESIDLSGILGRSLDFKPLADPRAILVEIADKLDAPKITADLAVPNGGYRWAFVAVPYVVQP